MSGTLVSRVSAALAMLCATTCASAPPPGLPTGAAADFSPGQLIAPELDLVVRLDLDRMKAALGETEAVRLTLEAARGSLGKESPLAWALPKAKILWIGLRPGLDPELTDNVVVLQGKFEGFDPRRTAGGSLWGSPRLLAGGFAVYERSKLGARSAPARIYLRDESVLVFASEATLDSTARIIELSLGGRGLVSPETGVASFSARAVTLAGLVQARSPRAARLLSNVQQLSGYADLSSREVSLKLRMVFKDREQARRTADAVKLLVIALKDERALVRLLRALKIEVVEKSLWLRASMTPVDFRVALYCIQLSKRCPE